LQMAGHVAGATIAPGLQPGMERVRNRAEMIDTSTHQNDDEPTARSAATLAAAAPRP
jgi:hypothetical protein